MVIQDIEKLVSSLAQRAATTPERLLLQLDAFFGDAVVLVPESSHFTAAERAALEEAGVDLGGPAEGEPDPLVASAARYLELMAGAWTVRRAAEELGVTPGRIRQRLTERSLYGVRDAVSAEWLLPTWQFADGHPIPGLAPVLDALPPRMHPLSVHGFMTRPDPDLELDGVAVSPTHWLASGGDPALPADLARLVLAAA